MQFLVASVLINLQNAVTSGPKAMDDLVLNDEALQQIHELEIWIRNSDPLMNDWGMRNLLMAFDT